MKKTGIGLKHRLLSLLIISVVIISLITPATASAASSYLGKLLDSYSSIDGEFTLSTSSRFYIVSETEPAGELIETVQLAQREFAAAGKPTTSTLEIAWGPEEYVKTGDIVIKVDSLLGAEAYQMIVSQEATVVAGDCDGLLYGLNTLLKYFRYNNSNTLEGFEAADAPDTKERTVMLDCARKYYSKEWICNFIRQMSWMGYNTIELHFSEDGGFRMDFWDPAYYKEGYSPENDFSWICGSHIQSWVNDPYREDPNAGEYLTTAEIVEILETAKEYHIDVIPSFDTPAHMDYLNWKFEQNYKSNSSYSFTYGGETYTAKSVNGCINYLGKTGSESPAWPYYTTVDITDGTVAKAFVFALYEDIADFFKVYAGSTDFSIGADEVAFPSGYGTYKWSYSAFPEYVNELNRMLNAKGYTCRMFNDFIGSTKYNYSSSTGKCIYDFDDNIEIMYWNSDFNPSTGKWDEAIWHVWFFWENDEDTRDWGDGDRIMYNCIQTNCYYVLRVAGTTTGYPNMDARNPENYNWTFYHSTEEDIYNEWYPADISEKGQYVEDAADVSDEYLGGAYFLIWNDYAALNTEEEVWNDVKDNTGTSDYTYSLINRMWSNIIKMWNSDVNSSLAYTDFADVRDTFGYFPGYTSSSKAASLPEATQPVRARLADNTELEGELSAKEAANDYTPESYAEYEEAYNEAVAVSNDYSSTAEEIEEALANLRSAEENLVPVNKILTLKYKAMVDGEEYTVKADETYELSSTGEFEIYLGAITGFPFLSVDGATYVPSSSGSSTCGDIVGKIKINSTVTIWFENDPSIAYLELILDSAETEQRNYTDASWAVYKAEFDKATEFLNVMKTDPPTNVTQHDVDAVAESFLKAKNELVAEVAETKIISITKLTATSYYGKLVGLKVKTSPDVTTLTVDGQTLSSCSSSVQTLSTGETVKIWSIKFKATERGKIVYTVRANETVTKKVTVTVK